jgi:AcrR family transcriptional regulator
MAVRLTREERQAQTREALIEAAQRTFLEHGYAGASLAHIADTAGLTTGAVYANFADKDDLFLAVFDRRAAESLEVQATIATADLPLDDALRTIARFLLTNDEEDPRWAALTAEYWARAAREPRFREAAGERFEAIVSTISNFIEELARRNGMRFALDSRDVARGGGALARGIRLERALGLDAGAGPESFEEMFRAYVRGLMRPDTKGKRATGGKRA